MKLEKEMVLLMNEEEVEEQDNKIWGMKQHEDETIGDIRVFSLKY